MSINYEALRLKDANALCLDFSQYTTVGEVAAVPRRFNLNVIVQWSGILSSGTVSLNVQEDSRNYLSVPNPFRLSVCDEWLWRWR
jgi:hypothetical protein